MTGEPISKFVINVKRECLQDAKTLASLDRGCSLTKILYIPRSNPTSKSGDYHLTFALFQNSQFEAALQLLKKEALLPEKGEFHVTGAGGSHFRDLISKTLGLEVVFLDEFLCQCRGAHFLVNNLNAKDILYPTPEVPEIKCAHSEALQKIQQGIKEKLDEKSIFPIIYLFAGTGVGISLIEEDGTFKLVGTVAGGGKTFLGLAKCLLGTNKYDEIMALANKGDRRNIDTQVSELMTQDSNSPYGQYPPDMPLLNFGKPADNDIGLEELKKEDVALALVAMTADSLVSSMMTMTSLLGMGNIYFGGNLIRGDVFRQECETVKLLMASMAGDIKYLKTGHTGALGAMISNPGDESKYFKV